MKLLITGGCGFLGSNLACHAIENGHALTIFDNLSRLGADQNRLWLDTKGSYTFIHGDTRNKNDVETLIRKGQFDAVFQLAGQVAMTTSIENPYKDFQTNTMGALHLLDAIRQYSPHTVVLFSSTNKVYGDLEQYVYEETPTRYVCEAYPDGFDERVPLDFRSPYGCSKGAADQYMLDYCRIFGIKTVVFRHSSMYGSRQYATTDQGWVGWFCQKAVEKYQNPACTPFTISGNGKQVRDILHAKDMIRLYFTALEQIDTLCGEAYNIGGTMAQSLSLLELFALLEDLLGIQMTYETLPPRQSDQKVFVADITKIKARLGWEPQVSARDGVEAMLQWVRQEKTK